MQYKSKIEKVAMMATCSTAVRKQLSLAEDLQIQRSRHILIVMLIVCLAFSVVTLVNAIFGSEVKIDQLHISQSIQVSQALTSILFDLFGLFVAYGYYRTGLRVFAWLNVILLIVVAIGVIVVVLFHMIGPSDLVSIIDDSEIRGLIDASSWDVSNILIIYIAIICISAFILSVIIIRLCFKLAHLIDANRRSMIQGI